MASNDENPLEAGTSRGPGRPKGSSNVKEIIELKQLVDNLMLENKNLNNRIHLIENDQIISINRNNVNSENIEFKTNNVEMSNLLSELCSFQRTNFIFQISNSIANLNHYDSLKTMSNFFRKFELNTSNLNEKEKINILISKFDENLSLIYDSLSNIEKNNYISIKNIILNSSKEARSRISNQNLLFSGVKRRTNESLLDFGRRVLNITKDSLKVNTPVETIEDLAITQFIKEIEDPYIRNSLVLSREHDTFDQILNKAVNLYENSKLCEKYKEVRNKNANNFNFKSKLSHNKSYPNSQGSPTVTFATQTKKFTSNVKFSSCLFCEKNHNTSSCSIYRDVESRINRLIVLRRCLRCVRLGHKVENCHTKLRCSSCPGENHHPFLCIKNINSFQSETTNLTMSNSDVDTVVSSTLSQISDSKNLNNIVLLKCIKCKVFNPNNVSLNSTALIMFDDGSTTSYISSALAKKLHLSAISNDSFKISVFHDSSLKEINSDLVSLNLCLKSGNNFKVDLRTIKNIAKSVPYALISDMSNYDVESILFQNGSPDILIGSDLYYEFEIYPYSNLTSGYTLLNSTLGNIIGGKGTGYCKKIVSCVNLSSLYPPNFSGSSNTNEFENLNKKVSNYFSLEGIGIVEEPPEKFCLDEFQKSIFFNGDRYEVCLPWKKFPPDLNANIGLCIGRLKSILKFLKSKPNLLTEYNKNISEQLKNDVIELVENDFQSTMMHYIPHQPVVRAEKNKLRIVYDASAKINKCSNSLNDCIYSGPLLLRNLSGILLRFRLYPVVVLADVEKAFHQVSLNPRDRDFTRFFWVKNLDDDNLDNNLVSYRFKRVSFGLTSSPFLLAITIINHFEKLKLSEFSDVTTNLYVDNLVINCLSHEIAAKKCSLIKAEFLKIGMNLREFVSNESKALSNLSENDKLQGNIHKILGLFWHTSSDCIEYHVSYSHEIKTISKQTILSFIASIYDPVGLISPGILPFKIFFQSLWNEDLKWSDPINSSLVLEWERLVLSINTSVSIKIPRLCTTLTKSNTVHELHAFADASSYAFSCCVYLRTISNVNSIMSNLIFSKSKVYPNRLKNKMSIHRAELLGVLIAVRAIIFCQNELMRDTIICKSLDKNLNIWTDSSTVLHWLRSTVKQETFIANRLKKILSVKYLTCRYVCSSDNPADIASRGCLFSELNNNTLWWHGPEWMKMTEFPTHNLVPVFCSNLTSVVSIGSESRKIIFDFERFSSWNRMLNCMMYVLRFLAKIVKKSSNVLSFGNVVLSSGCFTVEERNLAQLKLVYLSQQLNPPGTNEIENLNLKKSDGVWCSIGRINNSLVEESSKNPIWISRKCKFTYLFVYHTHRIMHHAGTNTVLNQIRSKFWFSQGRRTVFSIIYKLCLTCRKLNSFPYNRPVMPQLPPERVQQSVNFASTGVDYFGPLILKGNKKIWVCLFTCMVIRAIHMEIIDSLSTESFIEALRKFIARRGKPQIIFSDNAKHFVLAQKVLDTSKLKNPLYSKEFLEFLSKNSISWKFITERAAWKGGFFERLIGVVKNHIRKSLSKSSLSWSKFECILFEIELIVNCRPLSFVSDRVDSVTPIRPIDFLSPNINSSIITPISSHLKTLSSNKETLLENWKFSNLKLDKFWSSWHKDYLLSLRERYFKLNSCKSPYIPKNGEVVLIFDENLPKNLWKLGVIANNENLDENTRSVQLKLSSGVVTRRAVDHLFPLETSGE